MQKDKLFAWLDRCLEVVMEHIDYFEGQREVTGKAYHNGQKDMILLIMQEIREGSFDSAGNLHGEEADAARHGRAGGGTEGIS